MEDDQRHELAVTLTMMQKGAAASQSAFNWRLWEFLGQNCKHKHFQLLGHAKKRNKYKKRRTYCHYRSLQRGKTGSISGLISSIMQPALT